MQQIPELRDTMQFSGNGHVNKTEIIAPLIRKNYWCCPGLKNIKMPIEEICDLQSNIVDFHKTLSQRFTNPPLISYGINKVVIEMVMDDKGAVRKMGEEYVYELIATASKLFGITERKIISQERVRKLVNIRQAIMYLASLHCKLSQQRIGKLLGGRDHSTVIHSIKKAKEKIDKANMEFLEIYNSLK